MAKKKPAAAPMIGLFGETKRRHRVLILPRYLHEEAEAQFHRDHGSDFDAAHATLIAWADLESKGGLELKETKLDADFLQQVFGKVLGYASSTESPKDWQRERNFAVPGVGTADGALGQFTPAAKADPAVAIELKGTITDLDVDKSNGRTAVQQLWDYLGALPNTKWGIVSNFSEIRLYHKDRGSQAYELFTLQKLRDPNEFKNFWCLFQRGGLLQGPMGQIPRAEQLLKKTGERQKEVGDELYNYYSAERARLIEHLRHDHAKTLDQAIHIAQKIFDRIIFICLAESMGLIPHKILSRCVYDIAPCFRVANPRSQNLLILFHAVRHGNQSIQLDRGFQHPLLAFDSSVDEIQLDDAWALVFAEFDEFDYLKEVPESFITAFFKPALQALLTEPYP